MPQPLSAGGVRFTLGAGNSRTAFYRAPVHTAKWDEQKKGLRLFLNMPAHGEHGK